MPRYDVICPNDHEIIDYIKGMNEPYPLCPQCGLQTERLWTSAPGIAGDDIPGGIVIRHLGAEPRKYYSNTEIKRACNELGWTRDGDTPKAYKVHWSGRRKEQERPAPMIRQREH